MSQSKLWVGAALFAVMSSPAPAQQVPGGVQPGQIERQFQSPPQSRPGGGEAVVPASTDQKPPANAASVRFVLSRLRVEGSTVYGETELQSAYAQLLGKDVSLAQIYQVAEALTRRYRNDGYILSQVVVPAQSIRDGVIRLQVVEGFVANVRVEGLNRAPGDLVNAHLDRIRQARPLRAEALERALLLINDLAGVTARATLSPSAQAGASDPIVSVVETPRTFALGLNNRGSKLLGPFRMTADADFNSTFGAGERTGLRFIRTPLDSELTLFSATHERPLGTNGMKIAGSFTMSNAKPGVGPALAGLQTQSTSAQASLSYPLIRSRVQNLYLRGGLGGSDGKTDALAGTFQQRDQIRAVRFGVTWDGVDALRGVNIADLEYSRGMNSFGASDRAPDGSRTNVPAGFQKLSYYAARLQSIVHKWSALGAVSGQQGLTNLLAPEQFAFGGEQFGRGHDAADLIGDSGLGLKFELRYNDTSTGVVRDYMAYGFYDVGTITRRSPQPGELARQSASSTGLGVRFNLQRNMSGFVELGVPLVKTVSAEGNRNARLFAGVQANF